MKGALAVCALVLGLSAAGFSQQLSVSPTTLNFGPTLIGTITPAQTVTVTNTGGVTATISSVTPSGYYNTTSTCGTLAAGQSCTIDVTYSPGFLGKTNGTVTIVDSTAGSPELVTITGSTFAALKMTPAKLNFGSVAIGSTSQPQTVTLTNAQAVSASVTSIATSGNYSQTNNCPASLAAGASCAITVVFSPTMNTAIPGVLWTTTGTFEAPSPVALTGTGTGSVSSHVSFSPSSAVFGNKTDNNLVQKNITMTNTSSSTGLTVSSISAVGSPVYQISSNCPPVLSPNGSCTLFLSFLATRVVLPVSYPSAITVVDSDAGSPHVVGISGAEPAEIVFTPKTLSFPAQQVGTTTTKTLTLRNQDSATALLLFSQASGEFSVAAGGSAPCGASLAAGQQCTFNVSFTPTRTGLITGEITFGYYPQCDFAGLPCLQPLVVNASGTGQ